MPLRLSYSYSHFVFSSFAVFVATIFGLVATPSAGITNPNISAIGQVRGGITDATDSPSPKDPTLTLGEAEVVLDAALNPFINGNFTFSGGEDGVGVEEAYTSVVKGLPGGLGIKAGKYRLGFGKLNPNHPHSYPFLDTPHAWVSLIPGGEEGFNETALQISDLLPTPGDWASTISVDLLEGKSFHPDQEATRLGWLGRWTNAFLLGEQGALETGLSGAWGTDNTIHDAFGYLFGGDVKAKFYLAGSSQLTMQAEAVYRHGHVPQADSLPERPGIENRSGWVALCDYRYHTQWNIGGLAEQWDRENEVNRTDRAFKLFVGYAVLEESTLLRAAIEKHLVAGGDDIHTLSLQLLFSMGPHKAHTF
jgi:hypothetical protein